MATQLCVSTCICRHCIKERALREAEAAIVKRPRGRPVVRTAEEKREYQREYHRKHAEHLNTLKRLCYQRNKLKPVEVQSAQ
jgi:hypothetical protein